MLASMLVLTGCSEQPTCLYNEKEIGEILSIEDLCYVSQQRGSRQDCMSNTWTDYRYQRIKVKREIDNTVCVSIFHKSWLLKVNDKVRGPL